MKKRNALLILVLLFAWSVLSAAAMAVPAPESPTNDPFRGLTDKERSSIENKVLNNILKSELVGTRYRLFNTASTGVKTPQGLRRYSYTLLYDYTNNKTYNVVLDVTDNVPGMFMEV